MCIHIHTCMCVGGPHYFSFFAFSHFHSKYDIVASRVTTPDKNCNK